MSEQLEIKGQTRAERYTSLVPQLKALVGPEPDVVANMANICAALRQAMGFFWVGFYIVKGDQLVLGPFQGPIACTRISKDRGVCGFAWSRAETVIVPDVDNFPGHIACSSESRSEIVVPLIDAKGEVWAVLDVDSDKPGEFTETDGKYLREIAGLLKSS